MTTAKPQQVNDQPEAADDLIAELAKLMAQDAKGERRDAVPEEKPDETAPVEAAAPEPATDAQTAGDAPAAIEPFAFRLPGDAAPAAREPIPTPRFDLDSSEPVAPSAPSPAADPAPTEPFAFDFGLTPRVPDPQPSAPEAEVPIAIDEDHDAIGDLIAAELGQEIDAAENAFNTDADAENEAREPGIVPEVSATSHTSVVEPRGASMDGFRVAPVFGLGGPERRVEPAPPPVRDPSPVRTDALGQDPIDDIEMLIGDAIRVQGQSVEPEASPKPQAVDAAPALRSLATPVLPQAKPVPEPEPEPEPQPLSAEETILAAAAATGAQVGWADGQEADYETASTAQAPRTAWRRSGMLRALAGPAVAVVALLAAGIGLYSVLGLGGNDGPPPLLTADAEPAKEVPEPTTEAATPQSVVFNEISGNSAPAESEQLVSRDQSQVGEVATAPPVGDASAEGLVNRKVRTVTVRPDGTIVGGEDSVAGAAMLPVDRPNVPAVPGAQAPATAGTTPAVETASAAAAGAAGSTTDSLAAAGNDPLAALIATAPTNGATAGATPSTAPITLPAGTAANGDVPMPMPRIERPSAPSTITTASQQPASQPSSPVNAVIQGTLQPVSEQAPAQQQAAVTQQESTAPSYVQLSSQRSEEAAQQTAASLQTRFGNLFGGTTLEIQRVDLGERGIYYRVRLPAQSLENATQICNNVKAGGGDCFTL